GAGIPDTGTGGPLPNATPRPPGTTGTITFRTKIDDFYLLQPAALAPVVQGDVMSNDVAVTGQVAAFADLSPTAARQSDHSSAKVTLPRGHLTKSVYAINGNTHFDGLPMKPGDTVTFRLTYTLPSSSIVDYRLSDFLPLPVLVAGTTFNPVVSAAAPAA